LATYKSVEDLIAIGAYVKGSNPKVDQAVVKMDAIQGFLKQSRRDLAPWADTMEKMKAFLG
jgi:flagellum-specific ATP synthase